MIIVADSGSTKTDWRIIDHNKKVSRKQTIGLNPYIVAEGRVEQEVKAHLLKTITPEWISDIYFYGAGCSTDEKKNQIKNELLACFPKAKVMVEHDLLGAARAVCGTEPGVAGILGTGSNICFYDGTQIQRTITSRGWILGDEGSGNHMGRILIKDFLADRLPESILQNLTEEFELDKEKVLNQVYKKKLPNRYLAGFSKFIKEHEDNDYCNQIVIKAFTEFFTEQVSLIPEMKDYPLNLVGSVGYYFEAQLRKVAEEFDVNIGTINKKPIDNMLAFHM
ncbi:MAG: hypothetical protein ACXITV_06490 [Luteibaculaceae bacterium]